MSARDEILDRIRAALIDVPSGGAGAARPRRADASSTPGDLIELFAERVADYGATVHRCSWDDVADVVGGVFPPGARVVVPDGFPDAALPASVSLVRDDPANPVAATDLDRVNGVVTTSAIGIAVTGTVVLDHGPGQGRRALTLVPDRHVCIVRSNDVVDDVPAAVARLDPQRAQTWISGPSATSDIELSRVEGVHGPRDLHVVIVHMG